MSEVIPILNPALEKFLNKPCPQGPLNRENQSEYTMFTNALQMVLWIRNHGEAPKPEQVDEWQGVFSVNFRRAFEEIISGNPQEGIKEDPLFFDTYKTIREIPEEKWVRLESSIFV